MIVYIFGNPDLKIDSLPIRILPKLKKNFPHIDFQTKDPNEDWDIPKKLVIIDTVLGIEKIKIFTDLDKFSVTRRVSLHDFDLGAELSYLKKLGKIKKIKIIGIPPSVKESKAVKEITAILTSNSL